jgi:hypothetical protein
VEISANDPVRPLARTAGDLAGLSRVNLDDRSLPDQGSRGMLAQAQAGSPFNRESAVGAHLTG